MNRLLETKLRDNIKLVYRVIHDLPFIASTVDTEELEQIGKIALWDAMETYKEDSIYSLSTHCYTLIRSKVLDYLKSTMAIKNQPNDCIDDYEHKVAKGFEENVMGDLLIEEIKLLVGDFNASIFIERHLHSKTIKELSSYYDLSDKQIRNRLEKTKRILARNLKNWGNNT